ncbi:MAG: hypothetical protein JWL76_1320 [Thermoleophilia bacterium]|nr:hypothetical protein [Thermoleophilia bacterium]
MNERIVERTQEFRANGAAPLDVMCECSLEACEDMLDVPPSIYEQTRASATRFIVTPGHQIPEAEVVVEDHDTFLVVSKIGTGADVARERA